MTAEDAGPNAPPYLGYAVAVLQQWHYLVLHTHQEVVCATTRPARSITPAAAGNIGKKDAPDACMCDCFACDRFARLVAATNRLAKKLLRMLE
jgi:hypothetical protein